MAKVKAKSVRAGGINIVVDGTPQTVEPNYVYSLTIGNRMKYFVACDKDAIIRIVDDTGNEKVIVDGRVKNQWLIAPAGQYIFQVSTLSSAKVTFTGKEIPDDPAIAELPTPALPNTTYKAPAALAVAEGKGYAISLVSDVPATLLIQSIKDNKVMCEYKPLIGQAAQDIFVSQGTDFHFYLDSDRSANVSIVEVASVAVKS
nr:MAG: hypothetical protein [Bacteriophage sp.]